MIKSERLIAITVPGGPSFAMCYLGIQQARNGVDDLPIVLGIDYDEPIPEANVEFTSGTAPLCSVFAFPQAIPAPPAPPVVRGKFVPQVTKPPWSG